MSCKWQTNLYALPACIEGPTLFGGIIMSNDYVFNDTLPVAPLKIAALELSLIHISIQKPLKKEGI